MQALAFPVLLFKSISRQIRHAASVLTCDAGHQVKSDPLFLSAFTPFAHAYRLKISVAFTAAVSLLGTSSVFADTNYLDLTLEQLLHVNIRSASKKDEMIVNAPAAIYAITSADIERSGVTNIPDALRMVPGVDVAQLDSNSWAISIRGFNGTLANKLLVMIDGRTVYNPVFGGVLWEAHELMLEDIERIEVIRGPGGALWGANAVNGVINILTKHTRDTQGAIVSATYGNEEQGTLNARYGGELGETGSYRVYAKGFKRDSSITPAINGVAANAYDNWDGFRGGFRVDQGDNFTLQGDAYRTNVQQRRVDHSLIEPFSPIVEQNIVYEGANLLSRWEDQYQNESRLSVQAYVDWTKRDEPYYFVDERTTLDLETQYDLAPIANHAIIAGFGIRAITEDRLGSKNVQFTPQKDNTTVYSAFLQDKITLVPDTVFVTLGTKVEHNDFSGLEVQPNARLQWQVDHEQIIWSAVSRAVRTPTPIDMHLTNTFATAQGFRVALTPNEDVESEELTAYEIGYRHQITPAFSVDVAAFYNDYKNLSTTTSGTPEFVMNGIDPPHILIPVQFTNSMQGHTSGVEIVSGWQLTPALQLSATYSYLDISLEAIDATSEEIDKLSARHKIGTRMFWDIRDNLTLNTTATYVDKLPTDQVDSYVRLDINLGAKLSDTLRINLVGQNLLDSAHREFNELNDLNTAEIERSIFVKLTWQL